MDWTILTGIGAVLLILIDAIFGSNLIWLLRAFGLNRAANWLESGRSDPPKRPSDIQ